MMMMTRRGIQEEKPSNRTRAESSRWMTCGGKKKTKNETDEEEAKKVFVKSLASVNVTSEEEGTTRVVDVRASAEKYWERETVDRSGGDGEGSDDEKTLGAKNFIVEAASRNGGVVGEKFLFERLERVFPQTVFARAPVESFVFEGDDDDCEEEEEEEKSANNNKNKTGISTMRSFTTPRMKRQSFDTTSTAIR